jgi:glycogen synthase
MKTVHTVLMTADALGGVWTYALELSRSLNRVGITVMLAVMGPLTARQRRSVARLSPGVRMEHGDFRLEWMREPWTDVDRAGRWLLQLERACRPDIVHLNGYAHGNLPWRTPAVVVAHSCVYSWFTAVKQRTPPAQWDTYYRRVRDGLAAAKHVVAPSNAMLCDIHRHYGPFSPHRFSVVYNGIRQSRVQVSGLRKPLIVAAGRVWDEAKNMALLDRIASRVVWPLKVIGDTHHPEGFDCPLSNVECNGPAPRRTVVGLFRRASVYVSAALYEPFGLSALEAAMCGCALVLPDIPSSREIWKSAALYADPRNEDAYVSALNALAASPELRAEYSRRAREQAAAYTATEMARQYLSVYSLARGEPVHAQAGTSPAFVPLWHGLPLPGEPLTA